MRLTRLASRALAPAFLLSGLALLDGCFTWKQQAASPELATRQNPRFLKVTRQDGFTRLVYHARFETDSIIGTATERGDAARVAIPVSDVRSVAVQHFSAVRTFAILAGAGITAALVASAAKDPEPVVHTGSGGSGGGYGDGYVYSCPLVYSWTSDGWRLDSGTFGGAISAGLARTDVDNLIYASPAAGLLRLKVANELNETDHVDALTVVAVDHPLGTTVAPGPDGAIYTLGPLSRPLSARDYRGHDALGRLAEADGRAWESSPTGRDSARAADIRDGVELEFARPVRAAKARLVIDANITQWATYLMGRYVGAHGSATHAWYDSLDTRPTYAAAVQRGLASEAFLSVLVLTDSGWTRQGLTSDVGPEISKRQVIELDLGHVTGPTIRVRLESPPSFWLIDAVALDGSAAAPMRLTEMLPVQAVGREGQDVRDVLSAADRSELVLETGDSALVTFAVPRSLPGSSRSYLLRSHGWYRVNADDQSAPDVALLGAITGTRRGISRVATAQLSSAVAASNERVQ